MHTLDLAALLAYFTGVLAIGATFARRQGGATDYFLGQRDLPWWAVMFSIVATETSAITVISIPGLGARFGTLTRRVTSGVFLSVRSLADSVRVYATAIPLAVFLGWSIPLSVA